MLITLRHFKFFSYSSRTNNFRFETIPQSSVVCVVQNASRRPIGQSTKALCGGKLTALQAPNRYDFFWTFHLNRINISAAHDIRLLAHCVARHTCIRSRQPKQELQLIVSKTNDNVFHASITMDKCGACKFVCEIVLVTGKWLDSVSDFFPSFKRKFHLLLVRDEGRACLSAIQNVIENTVRP